MGAFLKENKQTTSLAEKLHDHCVKSLSYGDTLTFKAIEELTGMTRDNKQWPAFFKKFIKKIRKSKGWCFHSDTNIGYCLLSPTQTVTDRMIWRNRKAVSQARRAMNEASAVRTSELPQHVRHIQNKTIEMSNNVRKQAMRTSRILRVLTKTGK